MRTAWSAHMCHQTLPQHRITFSALGSGDATSNLMWRLQNGETAKGLKARVVLLYIGSSDLTYASFQVMTLCCISLLLPFCRKRRVPCGCGWKDGARAPIEAAGLLQGDDHINSMANATAIRTVRIADYLAQAVPEATVLILGLLPRGDITVLPDPAGFALPSK